LKKECLDADHGCHHVAPRPRAKQHARKHSTKKVAAGSGGNWEVEHLRGEDERASNSHENRSRCGVRALHCISSQGNPDHHGSCNPECDRHLWSKETVGDM